MSKPRKTIPVQTMRTYLQNAILLAKTREEAKAMCFAMDMLLHEAHAYKGFGFVKADTSFQPPDYAASITPESIDYYRRQYY